MGGLWSDEPGLAGEKFLHHGLLEGAGFVAALFERGEFGVHHSQNFRDGRLLDLINRDSKQNAQS